MTLEQLERRVVDLEREVAELRNELNLLRPCEACKRHLGCSLTTRNSTRLSGLVARSQPSQRGGVDTSAEAIRHRLSDGVPKKARLLNRNTNDFSRIPGLRLEDWMS